MPYPQEEVFLTFIKCIIYSIDIYVSHWGSCYKFLCSLFGFSYFLWQINCAELEGAIIFLSTRSIWIGITNMKIECPFMRCESQCPLHSYWAVMCKIGKQLRCRSCSEYRSKEIISFLCRIF